MSKREQLNKLLNEERIARATVEQLCNEWEWSLSDKEATIVNNIVINKGKVVEVPVVKETVVDNTDTATIEMLRKTIKDLNKALNDRNEEIDKLYKLYLEEQREKEVWAAAYDDLKEQNNILEEELMKAEEQNMFLAGQVAGYEMDINKLKAKIDKVKTNKPSTNKSGIVIDDEEFDEEPEEEPVVEEPKKETKATTPSHKDVEITLYDVRKTHDGVRGRTADYEFAWAIGKNVPAYKLNGEKSWKPMTGKAYTEARYIMNTLRNFMEQVKKEVEAKDKKKNNKPERTTKIRKEEPKQEQKNTVNTKEKNIYKANDKEVDTLGNTDEMEFC